MIHPVSMLTGFAAIIPADSEPIRISTHSGTVETVQIEITISGRIHACRTGTCSFYLNEDRIFCTSLDFPLKSMHSLICAKQMTVCGRLKAEGGNKKKEIIVFLVV
jgi:hypothetical protein